MLINSEVLSQIDAELGKIIEGISAAIYGDGSSTSLLEQAYITGVIAHQIGPKRLASMSQEQVSKWIKTNNLTQTEVDKAKLELLKASTYKWMASMSDDLTSRVRIEIARAEDSWANEVISRGTNGDLRKSLWDDLKEFAGESLGEQLQSLIVSFESVVDRFMQTELAKYFQIGQSANIHSEEEVYKIPRETACYHCLRLHVDNSGRSIVYKLKEVEGNSNIGKKGNEWQFVIGPVHPHSICGTQLIRTKTGLIPLACVTEGDEVWTRSGWKKVLAAWLAATKQTYTLRTKSGYELILTDEHRILVKNDERSKSSYFLRADETVGKWIHLTPDVGGEQIEQGNRTMVDTLFPTVWTEEAAYWVGSWIGDGSTNRVAQIYWASGDDTIETLDWGVRLERLLGVKPTETVDSNNIRKWTVNHSKTVQSLLPFKYNAPKEIFTSPNNVKAAFIRALFDTDGCITETSNGVAQITFVTTKKTLALDTQQLLLSLGIMTALTYHSREQLRLDKKSGKEYNHSESYCLSIRGALSRKRFRDSVGFSLPRKANKLFMLRDGEVKDNIEQEDVFMDRVESITPLDVRDVYDLMIEGDPEFVAQGLLVHNCYCILHRADSNAPTANSALARARRESIQINAEKRRAILEDAKRRYDEAIALER